MKRALILSVVAALLFSGCGSYTATGGAMGGQFGNMVGSAIGGIVGGGRGHDVGALIGTMGGAVAGAAIGAAVDHAHQRAYDEVDQAARRQQEDAQRPRPSSARQSMALSARPSSLQLRHVRIADASNDGILSRGEECTVSFEIMNNSGHTVYDVYPLVADVTANKHVHVSPSLRVESLPPYQGVRYTATVKADNRLKDGQIVLRVGVAEGSNEVAQEAREFTVPTRKKP